MKAEYIKALMFHAFEPEILSKYTGWSLDDPPDNNSAFPNTKFKELEDALKETKGEDYQDEDLLLVKFGYNVISQLSTATMKLKYEEIVSLPTSKASLALPDSLDPKECTNWAREPGWSDLQATLLSLGLPPGPLISHYFEKKPFNFLIFSITSSHTNQAFLF